MILRRVSRFGHRIGSVDALTIIPGMDDNAGGGVGRDRGRSCLCGGDSTRSVLVASQFQGFCRDLHTESVAHLMAFIKAPAQVRHLVQAGFTEGRQLDSKNAQPGSIGSDFGLLGIKFWQEVYSNHPRNQDGKSSLEELNKWRNAIAHQNFSDVSPNASPSLTLMQVRRWRSICGRLARSFDEVMRTHLQSLIGSSPWSP